MIHAANSTQQLSVVASHRLQITVQDLDASTGLHNVVYSVSALSRQIIAQHAPLLASVLTYTPSMLVVESTQTCMDEANLQLADDVEFDAQLLCADQPCA